MSKIAIDVVLLPPDEIMDFIIDINKNEEKQGNSKGALNKVNFLPHLSLAMGVIKKADFDKVIKIIATISEQFEEMNLEIGEPYFVTGEDEIKSYGLRVLGKHLQNFHEELMNQLGPFLTFDATREEIYKQEEDPDYVNTYKEKGSFENYEPHITLRCKEVTSEIPKIKFKGNRIAMCHIGKSTTCRKMLFETELRKIN